MIRLELREASGQGLGEAVGANGAKTVLRVGAGEVDRGGRAGFLGEAVEPVRARGEGLGQELHGDVAPEVMVAGTEDLAYAPGAQPVQELVPAEPHADRG